MSAGARRTGWRPAAGRFAGGRPGASSALGRLVVPVVPAVLPVVVPRVALVAGLIVGLVVGTGACGRPRGPEAASRGMHRGVRLVLLVLPGGLGTPVVSADGPPAGGLPLTERVLARSLVFASHVAGSPAAGPAYASALSGGDPLHHGVYADGESIEAGAYTVGEMFRDQGFETWAWLAHPAAESVLAGRGFEAPNRSGEVLTAGDRAFRDLLDRVHDEPTARALVLSAFPAGAGGDPSALVADLLDAVDRSGLGEASVALVASAYGAGPAGALEARTLDVPMVLRAPGVPAGRYDEVTRSADILPTLAGLVGFALPDLPTLSGVDLTPAISGGRRAPTLAARSHTADAAPAARLAVALSTRESLFRLDGAGGAFPLEVATRRAAGAQVVSAGDPQNPLHRRMLIELEAYREMLESDRRVRGGGSRQRGADGSSGAREIGQT